MKLLPQKWNWAIPLSALLFTIVLVAWSGNPRQEPGSISIQDTVPAKKKPTRQQAEKDLDKELRQLEKAKAELKELEEKDWGKMKEEIENAMKKLDKELMRMKDDEVLRKMDFEKMEKELQESIRKIDFEKIERDFEKSMKELDGLSSKEMERAKEEMVRAKKDFDKQLKNNADWQKEMQAMQKVNMAEVEKQMESARREMEKEMKKMDFEKLDMKEEMDNATVEIDKAMEELKGYQQMIYDMEKQGLLDTKKDYRIEYENGELQINGKKQSTQVTDKYKKYFKQNRDKTTIYKKDGDFNIDID